MSEERINQEPDVKVCETQKMQKYPCMNFIINFFIAVLIVMLSSYVTYDKKNNVIVIPESPDFSDIAQIGELATLKCYYHNVAEYEKQPDGLFKYGLFKVGYKKFWIEYTGTVEMGIDVSKVKIGQPDDNDIIRVYIPDVEKFIVNQDSNSVQEPIYETGVFTNITIEDKTSALALAQANMESVAKGDQSMIQRAHNNAKKLIEKYINNVGINLDKQYKVVWVGTPNEVY